MEDKAEYRVECLSNTALESPEEPHSYAFGKIDLDAYEAIAVMFETCYQSSYLRGDEVAKIIRGRYCK